MSLGPQLLCPAGSAAPPPPPEPLVSDPRTLLQFNLDAYPIVDEAGHTGITATGLIEDKLVTSPTIGGTGKAWYSQQGHVDGYFSTFGIHVQAVSDDPSGTDPVAIGTDGFSIEFFLRYSDDGGANPADASYNADIFGGVTTTGLANNDYNGSETYLSASVNSSSIYVSLGSDIYEYAEFTVPYTAEIDAWAHIAVVLDTDELRLYVGGELVHTESLTRSEDWVDLPLLSHSSFTEGGITYHQNDVACRYIDCMRVRSGATYTGSSFTPPAAQFAYP